MNPNHQNRCDVTGHKMGGIFVTFNQLDTNVERKQQRRTFFTTIVKTGNGKVNHSSKIWRNVSIFHTAVFQTDVSYHYYFTFPIYDRKQVKLDFTVSDIHNTTSNNLAPFKIRNNHMSKRENVQNMLSTHECHGCCCYCIGTHLQVIKTYIEDVLLIQ